MKEYEEPEINITEFYSENIVTESTYDYAAAQLNAYLFTAKGVDKTTTMTADDIIAIN